MRKEHTKLCIASYILAIVGFIFFMLTLFTLFGYFWFASIICSLLAMIFGAISYFGKGEDSYALAGLASGTVVLSLSLFLFVLALLIAST